MINPFTDKEKILANEFAYAIYDGFPVLEGHMLGDVVKPRGGVRNIIPGKGDY